MFAIALVYRAAVCVHFLLIGGMAKQWTNEVAAIAHSLVLHHSFGGTYWGYTGPTAWLAPVYPFLVAGIFRIFGIDSTASAVVLFLLNSIFSSLTALVIYRFGREHFGEKVALIAAWAWIVSPLVAMMPLLLWDTSLSALMFTIALFLLLRASSPRQWSAAGALWGFCALISPALLAPLPVILVYRIWAQRDRPIARLKPAIAFCLIAACVVLPWTIRNHVVMHANFPVRSNAWAEIYFGNVTFAMHPCARPDGLYQQIGETRFVLQLRDEVIRYIRAHPGPFVLGMLQRTLVFWLMPFSLLPITILLALGWLTGGVFLALNRGWDATPFLAIPIFSPIIYSMAHIEARYRHPIEPVIYLMGAYGAFEIAQRCRLLARNREVNAAGGNP